MLRAATRAARVSIAPRPCGQTNFLRALSKKKGNKGKKKDKKKDKKDKSDKAQPKAEQPKLEAVEGKPAADTSSATPPAKLKKVWKEKTEKAWKVKRDLKEKEQAAKKAASKPTKVAFSATATKANPFDAFVPQQAAAKIVQEKTALAPSSSEGGPPLMLIGGAAVAIAGAAYYFSRDAEKIPLDEVPQKVQVLLTSSSEKPAEKVAAPAAEESTAPAAEESATPAADEVAAPASNSAAASAAPGEANATPVVATPTQSKQGGADPALQDRLTQLRKFEKDLKLSGDVAESIKREKHRIKQLLHSATAPVGLEADIMSAVKDALFEYKLATDDVRGSFMDAVGGDETASFIKRVPKSLLNEGANQAKNAISAIDEAMEVIRRELSKVLGSGDNEE
jgi:hypothetical protein